MPNSDEKKKILLKLRDVRREKGMSLHDLADKMGVDYQKVGRMERGETQMTIDMLSQLAKALKVPVSKLLNEDNISDTNSDLSNKNSDSVDIYLIPTIYTKLEKLCDRYKIDVENSAKIYLATTIFKCVQDICTKVQDEKGMVEVFFQAFDAIFERLVVNRLDCADE
ncbi:MAG: helix-turn-helix transcriptional regulator [Legionellales bacterium]|nr:helix-turn-helix transcriptional regulator [Legionellales bacterium]